MSDLSEVHLGRRLKSTFGLLLRFFRNPLPTMKTVPNWDWPDVLITQVLVAIPCGIISGLASGRMLSAVTGVVLYPLSSVAVAFIGTFFLFSVFRFLFSRELPIRHLYLIVVLANIPASILGIFSRKLPPIQLVGFAFSALLLIVGLSENFSLPRKSLMRLFGVLYALFLGFWITGQIHHKQKEKSYREYITPDSLEILEQEIEK